MQEQFMFGVPELLAENMTEIEVILDFQPKITFDRPVYVKNPDEAKGLCAAVTDSMTISGTELSVQTSVDGSE